MTQPGLSPADAYALALLPAVSGVALSNYEIIDAVAKTQTDEKLGHAIQFARGAVKISELRCNEALEQLSDTATRAGLTLPERPTTAVGHRAWLSTLRTIGQQAVPAPGNARAAFAAGVAAGDLHQTLWIGRNVIYLRTAAPEHGLLRQVAADLARALGDTQRRLSEALAQGTPAVAVTQLAEKLAELFAQTPDLVSATTKDSFKEYFEWATQVSTQLDALGPALHA